MAADRKVTKKDKEILLECESSIKDIRQQLTDQLRCLDQRLECHVGMLVELQDFYKMNCDVEREFARGLDKLYKQITTKHKAEKQRRENWQGYATYDTWQMLLKNAKQRARDHQALSDIYGQLIFNKIGDISEDLQSINKNCRDMLVACQEEVSKVLTELQTAMKSYHASHGESQQSEVKLIRVQSQKPKTDQQNPIRKRFRNDEKKSEKTRQKYDSSKLMTMKARNDYLLAIVAANAALHKYFAENVPVLMKKMESGYLVMLSQVIRIQAEAELCMIASDQKCVEAVEAELNAITNPSKSSASKFTGLKMFTTPEDFKFQPHGGDEIEQISAQRAIQDEMVHRFNATNDRLKEEKLKAQEASNGVVTAELTLMSQIGMVDWDVKSMFGENPVKYSISEREKKKLDRIHAEEVFFVRFKDYMQNGCLLVRLQARYNALERALGVGSDSSLPGGVRPPSLPPKPKKLLSASVTAGTRKVQPKLFGGSIEEYVKAMEEDIPIVVLSCVRVINLCGLHHQGIFRVSGSQADINNYKAAFEKGQDPLSDTRVEGDDINAVAGLLKLYFRELREPLFPMSMFDELILWSQSLHNTDALQQKDCVQNLKQLLANIPKSFIVVLRYLFAFLSHVSEYSDENMMDAYNLSVCFGPTLIPVPDDRDLVQMQTYVNELIKNVILHHEELFPPPANGETVYEKWIVSGDSEKYYLDHSLSDDDLLNSNAIAEEDEADEPRPVHTAVAQFKFEGRTGEELSFNPGDVLTLFYKISPDWWKGALNGKNGKIPDAYIQMTSASERLKSHSDSLGTNLRLAEGLNRSTDCLMTTPFVQTTTSLSPSAHTSLPEPGVSPTLTTFMASNKTSGTRTSLDDDDNSCISFAAENRRDSDETLQQQSGGDSNEVAADLKEGLKYVDGVLAKVMTGIERLDQQLQLEDPPQQKQQSATTDSSDKSPLTKRSAARPDPPVRSANTKPVLSEILRPEAGRPEPPVRSTPVRAVGTIAQRAVSPQPDHKPAPSDSAIKSSLLKQSNQPNIAGNALIDGSSLKSKTALLSSGETKFVLNSNNNVTIEVHDSSESDLTSTFKPSTARSPGHVRGASTGSSSVALGGTSVADSTSNKTTTTDKSWKSSDSQLSSNETGSTSASLSTSCSTVSGLAHGATMLPTAVALNVVGMGSREVSSSREDLASIRHGKACSMVDDVSNKNSPTVESAPCVSLKPAMASTFLRSGAEKPQNLTSKPIQLTQKFKEKSQTSGGATESSFLQEPGSDSFA